MALADYRLCDICGSKAFYDARLNYVYPDEDGNGDFGNNIMNELVQNKHYKLDYLGSWKVLCQDCAMTHKIIIEPIAKD